MTDQPDNLEPWQRVAREMGTFREVDRGNPYTSMVKVEDAEGLGQWVEAEASCREIARLRAEIEELERQEAHRDRSVIAHLQNSAEPRQ